MWTDSTDDAPQQWVVQEIASTLLQKLLSAMPATLECHAREKAYPFQAVEVVSLMVCYHPLVDSKVEESVKAAINCLHVSE